LQLIRNPNCALASIIPAWPPGGTRSGPTNITVNLPRAAEARDVTRVLNRWARVNG